MRKFADGLDTCGARKFDEPLHGASTPASPRRAGFAFPAEAMRVTLRTVTFGEYRPRFHAPVQIDHAHADGAQWPVEVRNKRDRAGCIPSVRRGPTP
jgi:hypothetical protein